MTIASTATQTTGANTNGAATSFSFSFRLFANGDVTAAEQIQVVKVATATGAEEILTLNSDYSVSVNSDQDSAPGGSVTISPALPSGFKIYVRRAPNFLQSLDLQSQGSFSAEAVETNFDQVKIELQDLRARVLRAPHTGLQTNPNFSGEITGTPIAGQITQINATATGYDFVDPTESSSENVTATGTTTPLTLANWMARELWAEAFGASPSASASTNATALQAWIDACAVTGKIGRIGPGIFEVDATLIMKDGAKLRGSGHFNFSRNAYDYTDSNPTVIKNDGTLTGTNSVVFRCSQMAVGVRGNDFTAPDTSDLQDIEVSYIHFDANGAQYAAYYYRCGNESLVHRVSHSGATVAGAFMAGLFAATGWHLSAMQNAGAGFLIGQDTADTNLTDEAALNAFKATLYASRNGGIGIDGRIARGSRVEFVSENNDGDSAVLRQYGGDSGSGHWHELYSENPGGGRTVLYYSGANALGLRLTRDYAHRGSSTIVSIPHFYGDGTTNAKTVTGAAGITAAQLYVYADGVRLTPTTHYTVADNGADLDVTPTSNWSTSVRYAIHGNTSQTVTPDVLTLIACDESGNPSAGGGPSEPAYWPLIDGRFVNIAGSFINANSGRYRLDADGRSNAQTTLQFINRAPLRTRPHVLAQSAVAASVTGTTSETALATIVVPAGAMGANGAVRITTLWSHTNSANNKLLRIRFGGASGTSYLGNNLTTTATLNHVLVISNRNAANSQIGGYASATPIGSSTGAAITSSADTSLDTSIVISGQLADSGETITLERYVVEVLPKA